MLESDFRLIYDEHKKLVYNLALQYTQQTEDAEEITQDVFLAVHQSLSNFKQESKLSTWIYRITINKSIDFIKAKQRKKRFGLMTSLFFEKTNEIKFDKITFDHPGVDLESKEKFQELFRAINSLGEKQRTAFILNRIEQINLTEIAAIMELSEKAVDSLVQRAKQNVLKMIK